MEETIIAIVALNLIYGSIFCGFLLKLGELRNQALTDALTGLPNRLLLLDRLKVAIANAKRNHSDLSVLFIDLNGFKGVNDKYGHGVGDSVLAKTAERIQSCIRASDTLARLGGDEFVLIMQTKHEQDITNKADQIAREVSRPIDGIDSILGVSIGVSFFRDHSEDPVILLSLADEAMYVAKKMSKVNNSQSALVFYRSRTLDSAE